MRSRRIGTLIATLVAVGMVAPPALAGDESVGVLLQGLAEVGRNFPPGEECTKQDQPEPKGNGIRLPLQNSGDYKYRLRVPNEDGRGDMFVAGTTTNGDNGKKALVPRTGFAALSICGNIGPVKNVNGTDLGAWCDLSKGYNGTGKLHITWGLSPLSEDVVQDYQLSDVGWKASAGTVLPVIGKWRKLVDDSKNKKDIWGTLLAAISARGMNFGADSTCNTDPTGGRELDMDGVIALVSVPGDKSKESVVRPNDLPGLCKTGEPPCLYDPKKKPAPDKDKEPTGN